jgi:predicted dehydrogenase
MTPIRIAVFGAGDNTREKHIPLLRAIEGVEIAGVCNRSLESSQRAAKAIGVTKTYRDYTELVADPQIHAVVIGTWPYMHAPVTIAALNAGKHVLCEARMAMNAAEAHAMFETSKAHPSLVAQIVPAPFTLRVDKTIQKMLADGAIGDVLAVEVRAGGGFFNPTAPMAWRQNIDLSGFNIMGMGIWYETLMRWVGHASSVAASGKIFQKMRKDDAGVLRAIHVPEHVDIVADMACGAQLHMQVSSVTGLAGPNEIFLFGKDGTLRISGDKLFYGKRGDQALAEVPIAKELEGRWRVEEEFINAIRGKEQVSHTTFTDGVKYMEFTEAVARSIATGHRISLPLPSPLTER